MPAAAALGLCLLLPACDSCGKKDDGPVEVPGPPRAGGATADLVSTGIGNGLGLAAHLAPTSTKWERVVVTDDASAVLLGRVLDEAIALRTTDRGRTWTSLRATVGSWASWGVGADGSLALVSGDRRKGAPPGRAAAVDSGRIWFAGAGAEQLDGPRPFFPDEGKLAGVSLPSGAAGPAVLAGSASLLLDRTLAYMSSSGTPMDPVKLSGSFVPVPYGRPPQLLSTTGGAIETRPWPESGAELDPPSPVPHVSGAGNVSQQLAAGPGCEAGPYSFQRIGSDARAYVVGVAGDRALGFGIPPGEDAGFGCGPDAVVIHTVDTKIKPAKKSPILVRCTLAGKCAEPKSLPFDVWSEPHERAIRSVPTSKGVVATLQARAGSRWGVYLAQSNDAGATFELPRVIGEGKTDQGMFEVGALVRFRDRILVLLSADVTGQGRRGWYVLVSNDDGNSWGPP